MKKLVSRLTKVIVLATIPFIIFTTIDFLIEITGGKFGNFLLEHYGINQKHLFLSLLGLLFFSLIYQIYLQWREEKYKTESVIDDNVELHVKNFFNSLKERYKKRYDSKLDGRFEITLKVSENWQSLRSKTYKFDAEAKISDAIEAINKAFDEKGRLLVVGSPGSGKTVLLLKFALELLGGEYKTGQQFPVIFNLASWSPRYANFEDWLVDVLNSANGLSKAFAKKFLKEKRIIFLLDGLDELAHSENAKTANNERAKCLNSLNDYLREGRKTVICCRREEFVEMQKATDQDAPVSAKVEVLDLTKANVLLALQHAQSHNESRAAAEHLKRIIEANETFLEVLSTPFYFTTALEVFDKPLFNENNSSKDTEEIKKYLLNEFTKSKISHTQNLAGFTKEKDKEEMRRWFIWFAKSMKKKQLTSFELTDLQPRMLTKAKYFDVMLSWILVFIGWIISLVSGMYWGLYFGLFLGVYFLFLGIYLGLVRQFCNLNQEILFRNIIKLNFQKLLYFRFWVKLILIVILVGLLSKNFFIFGWLIGSVCGLEFFFNVASKDIFSETSSIYIRNAYQKLNSSFFFTLQYTLILLIVMIFFGFLDILFLSVYLPIRGNNYIDMTKIWTLSVFEFFYLFLSFFLLNTPLFRHFVLRFCLYLEGSIPMKYATFLDYAAEARILEKDGGQWRFRHQTLQEYFANSY
jgi:DNA replication protein DnaC